MEKARPARTSAWVRVMPSACSLQRAPPPGSFQSWGHLPFPEVRAAGRATSVGRSPLRQAPGCMMCQAPGRAGGLAVGAGHTVHHGLGLPECHSARPVTLHAPRWKTRVRAPVWGPRFWREANRHPPLPARRGGRSPGIRAPAQTSLPSLCVIERRDTLDSYLMICTTFLHN